MDMGERFGMLAVDDPRLHNIHECNGPCDGRYQRQAVEKEAWGELPRSTILLYLSPSQIVYSPSVQ